MTNQCEDIRQDVKTVEALWTGNVVCVVEVVIEMCGTRLLNSTRCRGVSTTKRDNTVPCEIKGERQKRG